MYETTHRMGRKFSFGSQLKIGLRLQGIMPSDQPYPLVKLMGHQPFTHGGSRPTCRFIFGVDAPRDCRPSA